MRRLALALVLTAALAACGSGADSGSAGSGTARDQLRAGDPGGQAAPAKDGAAKPGLTDVAIGRATIRTGTLAVRVGNVPDATRAVIRAAEAAGGYLESERTDTDRTELTVRVPPEDFTATADAVSRLGTVTDRTVSTEDVTGDVADVEGRLKAARASVARVRALMARANTISEITSLESELNSREAALESLETRRRALAGKTAFSALTVTLVPPDREAPAARAADAGFTSGLRAGWDVFTTSVRVLLVVLGALLPFAAVVLLGLGLYYTVRRRLTARA